MLEENFALPFLVILCICKMQSFLRFCDCVSRIDQDDNRFLIYNSRVALFSGITELHTEREQPGWRITVLTVAGRFTLFDICQRNFISFNLTKVINFLRFNLCAWVWRFVRISIMSRKSCYRNYLFFLIFSNSLSVFFKILIKRKEKQMKY